MTLKPVSDEMEATGFKTVRFKGVEIPLVRPITEVTDSGWIGPDHPKNATEAWGRDMLKACAEYIADFMGALVGALLLERTGICKTGVARGSPRLPSRFRKGDIAPVCLTQIDFADNLHGCMHGKYGHAVIDYVYTFFDTRVCGGAVTAKTSLA